jgi:1-acyl-sn-glycerol-3-phosphate acyltransferase
MMRLALAVYYRNCRLTGFHNVPDSGPAIFACNHPNSFLDAMIVGAYIKRETHFLARSDVFNSPMKLWILSQFKLIPIYRLQEGAENLVKNKDTFDRCHAIFRKGGAILMFSEGLCIQELRLRPLKKGTARIALEYSKDGAQLTIIPTGLNYLNPMKFREDVLVSMDTPFNAAEFAVEFNENNSKGIQSLSKRLLTGLQNVVIDIHDKAKEKEIAQMIETEYNNEPDINKLVNITKLVNELKTSDEAAYNKMISLWGDYRESLMKNNTIDETVAKKAPSALWLVLALPVFGLAFWLYILPIGLARSLVKSKVRLPEFHDSVMIGASVIFVFVYWLIILVTVSILSNFLFAVGVVVALGIVADLAGPAYDVLSRIRAGKMFEGLPEQSKIREQRKRVSDSVFNLVESHQAHHPVG